LSANFPVLTVMLVVKGQAKYLLSILLEGFSFLFMCANYAFNSF